MTALTHVWVMWRYYMAALIQDVTVGIQGVVGWTNAMKVRIEDVAAWTGRASAFPQKALRGVVPGPFLEPLVRAWSYFGGICRQKLTKSSKIDF